MHPFRNAHQRGDCSEELLLVNGGKRCADLSVASKLVPGGASADVHSWDTGRRVREAFSCGESRRRGGSWPGSRSLVILCFLSAFGKEKKQEAQLSLMCNSNNAVGVGSGSKTG